MIFTNFNQQANAEQLTVLIADDHSLVREGLKLSLQHFLVTRSCEPSNRLTRRVEGTSIIF